MNNTKSTLLGIVGFVAVMFVIYYILDSISEKRTKDIIAHRVITDGMVVYTEQHSSKGATTYTLQYEFRANGTLMFNTTDISDEHQQAHRRDLEGAHFPVVYSSVHPDVSDMLLTKKDSLRYHVQ
jgi:hypothetical protein